MTPLHDLARDKLAPDMIRALSQHGRTKTHAKGAVIHQEGDVCDSFSIVKSGRVEVSRQKRDGTKAVSIVIGPGGTYGLSPMLSGRRRKHSCEALDRCEIIYIRAGLLRKLIEENAAIRDGIIRFLCERLSLAYDTLENERGLSLSQRLGDLLLDRADRTGCVLFTQSQLAEQLGVSRVSIGLALRDMQAAGLVRTGYRRVEIDRDGLRRSLPVGRASA